MAEGKEKMLIKIKRKLAFSADFLRIIVLQGSRKRLKAVGAENQVPLICSEIPEFSQVLMDFYGCKTALLKKVWVQLHPLHLHLRDPCKLMLIKSIIFIQI